MKNKVNSEILELYRSLLPHGAQREIAKRVGVREQSVSSFLAGRSRSKRIEDETLNYIAELRQERQVKLKAAGLL